MKTHKRKALCFTYLLTVLALGLIAIIGTGGGCSSDGEGDRSIASSGIRLNEILFFTNTGPEWVELYNVGSDPMDISLFQLSNERGNIYIIPEDLPMVPPGCYVVILFDGLGSSQNDYDFNDGYALLHTDYLDGDVFDNKSDICTIFSNESEENDESIDFVAWGDYGHRGKYIKNADQYGGNGPVRPNETIGVHPEVYEMELPTSWVIYAKNESTRGVRNLIPAPKPLFPYKNITIRDGQVGFAWRDWLVNVKKFILEVDDADDFVSPLISVETKSSFYTIEFSLPDGTYYWRVRTITKGPEESSWSKSRRFRIEKNVRSALIKSNDLEIEPVLQRKDTSLLCPACYEETDPTTGTKHPWNEPHDEERKSSCPHCKVYCGRACIVMINKHFEGHISQDWISYKIYSAKTDPADQLGHYDGFDGPDMKKAQAIALKGQPQVPLEKFSFKKVMQYIDEKRPMIGYIHPEESDEREEEPPGRHVVVIDGYDDYEDEAEDTIHVLQPFTGKQELVTISETQIGWISAPPANSKGVVMEELGVDLDADNDDDKVKDFDEKNRFFTKFAEDKDKDSDGDGLTDFIEIRSWAHGKGSQPRYPHSGWDIWNKPNFDYDIFLDGEEDLNKNGDMDPDECDPFVTEQPIVLLVDIAGADLGSPTAKLNAKDIELDAYTGSKAGYQNRVKNIWYCGILKSGQNILTITARQSGADDGYDDIQIRAVIIENPNEKTTLLRDYGTYHLGNNTLQSIWEEHENGHWNDPNPPGFWAELHGLSVQFTFNWNQ